MAAASGLALLADEERNCSNTTTYGTGLLIRHALENGATSIYLCLGGSATCDGGTGMAAALGYTFEDINGDELYPAGRNLDRIERIVPSGKMSLVRDAAFTLLADVRNPLFGPEGAAFVYAPQKGACPGEVKHLDAGLRNLSALVWKLLNRNLGGVPGAGAAGGLGFGAMAFLDAKLIAGSAEILRITGFRDKINRADLVITGEGRLDEQSKQGKVVSAVLDVARSCNKPVGILCGTNALPHGDAFLDNFFEVSSLAEFSDTLEEAVNNPEKYIEKALDKLIVAFRSI